jgi:hypothetical protein
MPFVSQSADIEHRCYSAVCCTEFLAVHRTKARFGQKSREQHDLRERLCVGYAAETPTQYIE